MFLSLKSPSFIFLWGFLFCALFLSGTASGLQLHLRAAAAVASSGGGSVSGNLIIRNPIYNSLRWTLSKIRVNNYLIQSHKNLGNSPTSTKTTATSYDSQKHPPWQRQARSTPGYRVERQSNLLSIDIPPDAEKLAQHLQGIRLADATAVAAAAAAAEAAGSGATVSVVSPVLSSNLKNFSDSFINTLI